MDLMKIVSGGLNEICHTSIVFGVVPFAGRKTEYRLALRKDGRWCAEARTTVYVSWSDPLAPPVVDHVEVGVWERCTGWSDSPESAMLAVFHAMGDAVYPLTESAKSVLALDAAEDEMVAREMAEYDEYLSDRYAA